MDNLSNSLKFFFYILRLCGLNSIDLGQRPFIVSKLWATYSLLFLLGYGYFHVSSIQVDLKEAQPVQINFVTALIDYYNKYSGLVLFVTSILVTLIRQRRLIDFLVILEDHDLLFERLPAAAETSAGINYESSGRIPIYWFSLNALAIGVFEYTNCIMYIQDFITFNDYCLLMCIVPLFVSMGTLIQLVYFVWLIRNRLQLLADLLKGHRMPAIGRCLIGKFNCWQQQHRGQQDADEGRKKLDTRVIQSLYLKLHAATEALNSVFGVQIVVLLTALFITLTTLSYFTCMQVIRLSKEHSKATSDDVLSWIGTGLWIILFLIKIFTMCYHCQQVKEQGAACGHYLHQYLIDHQYQSERREIRTFSQQVLTQLFIIRPCGLFNLDMAMGFSIIGAITTYLVILIQFDISQEFNG